MPRRLGQHFLTDPGILERIVDALRPQAGDIVIEVGPGRGTLTRRLAPRVARVVAIEKDRALADALRTDPDKPAHVHVVPADALRADWHALVRDFPDAAPRDTRLPFKVAGNIPYAVTAPLIEKALTPPLPAMVVYLVQREVGERLAAPPGSRTYGALSVGVQATARVELLFTVRAGSFRPPPRVDSVLVRLVPRSDPLVEPGERPALRAFLADLFSRRRKQLARSLRDVAGAGAEEIRSLLADLGIDPADRPETLDPATLVALFRVVRR